MMLALQGNAVRVPGEFAERILNQPIFTIGNTPVTPVTLFVFGAIILVSWVMSLLLQRAARRGLELRSKADPATVTVVARLVHYAILLVGLGVALQTVGINVAALFAAGAFFAIALGFAMQNVAENFVSGVILMTERTIKPGDILNVDNTVVRVTRLGLRATVVRTRDEEDMIIPNSVLVRNTVTNYTLRDSIIRLRATVGVSYRSDLALVTRVLNEAAANFPGRVEQHAPIVLLTGFGYSAVNFEVSVWISDPWQSRRALSALNETIWWTLHEHEIRIPFPQRDVDMIPS